MHMSHNYDVIVTVTAIADLLIVLIMYILNQVQIMDGEVLSRLWAAFNTCV